MPSAASKGLVLLAALGIYWVWCHATELDCERAANEASDGIAVLVCKREYQRTGDPDTGLRLANALRRSNDIPSASAIATSLIASTASGNALQTLGKIAIAQGRFDQAIQLLQTARTIHDGQADTGALAMDDQALYQVYYDQARYADALQATDNCLREARTARNRTLEGLCHTSAATVLSNAGYFESAQLELEHAEPLLTEHRHLDELESARGALLQRYELGPLHQNFHAEAVRAYEAAIEHAKLANRPARVLTNELNLIYSLAEIGKVDEAARHLELARRLDVDGKEADDCAMLEARIAYRRGNRALAFQINQRIYDQLTDDQNPKLNVAVMQARIALADGDLPTAETWANRGVEMTEHRLAHAVLEMRPWVLSNRRQPYELLFTTLVREHKLEDAVVVLDQWHGRILLDALSGHAAQPSTLHDAGMHTDDLRRMFPVWRAVPLMQAPDRDHLLAKLANVDVVALAVAEDEVWRITSHHQAIDIVDVGPFAQISPQIVKLQARPTDRALAETLGVQLLGEAAFHASPDTLHVVLDGRLADLPVVALRAHGKSLISLRAIVQPPRLSEVDCVPGLSSIPRVAVFADAQHNLPNAREAAIRIAHRFAVEPHLGADVTRDAVLAMTDVDLLQVAVHGTVEISGGALSLRDGALSALELIGHHTPPLAVVTACESADAADSERATALSTAFLAGGSHQVIATLRPVTDPGARAVIDAFYDHLYDQGVADPVRALQLAQAALADSDTKDWAYFAIFGHDTCRKDSL
jgi:tetratricopeptide (TPR) repeat protein